MITPFGRDYRPIVLAAITWGWAAGVAAQTPDERSRTTPAVAAVKAQVPIGGVVFVTDKTGVTFKGKLVALTDDAVQVKFGADVRSVSAAEVARIQWQQADSPLTGVLIGAAVGAIPGIYWLAVDPNECSGMCPEEYALIAIGAVVGGAIDHVIRKKVTVYPPSASSGRAKGVAIGPVVRRDRQGIQVAVTF